MQFGPVIRAAHLIYFIFFLKSAQLATYFWPSQPIRGSSPSSDNTRATTTPSSATAPCAADCHSPPRLSSGIEPASGRLHFPSSLNTTPFISPPYSKRPPPSFPLPSRNDRLEDPPPPVTICQHRTTSPLRTSTLYKRHQDPPQLTHVLVSLLLARSASSMSSKRQHLCSSSLGHIIHPAAICCSRRGPAGSPLPFVTVAVSPRGWSCLEASALTRPRSCATARPL
jgi:hypothetical protein